MVKKLLFLSLMFLTFVTWSQVTVTSSNLLDTNELSVSSIDTLPPAIDLLGTGNQAWDFSQLVEMKVDSTFLVDPAGTPYASDFPTANMETDDGSIYMYLQKDSSGIRMLGIEGDFFGSGNIYFIEFLPNGQEQIYTPLTYQSQDSTSDYYELTIDANDVGAGALGDSAKSKHVEYTTRIVDAYGQVSIPNASFDCIRVNKTTITIDSSWIHNQYLGWQFYQAKQDTTYNYEWFSDDPLTKFSVASVDYNPATNQPVDSTDFSFLKFDPIKVHIPQGKGFGIYPNPAKDNFYVYGLLPGSKVQVLDITGKVVTEKTITSSKERIDLSSIKTGIYFVKAISGKKVYLKKLIVQ